MWAMRKQQQACFWTAEEIDLADDKQHLLSLRAPELSFLFAALAFFAVSDKVVADNLSHNFMSEVTSPEAQCFYAAQTHMENVHQETYGLMLETHILDQKIKQGCFAAAEAAPSVRAKVEWAKQFCDPARASFAERLVAFAVVEGALFSGALCAIFWFKQRGLMPGLCFANELISRA